MNYNVPQFTDVEDRIIGSFTLKQFGIIFAAGALIVAIYSVTKSVILLILSIIVFGIPAFAVALVVYNGRHLYNTLFTYGGFFTKPRLFVFHKQAKNWDDETPVETLDTRSTPRSSHEESRGRLKDIYYKLETTAKTQEELLKK